MACKIIAEEKPEKSRVHAELSILSNLGKCNFIVNFHGLCEKDGTTLDIFGWAENGNLKELYEKYDIEWSRKLKIITNIVAGLLFFMNGK